MRNPLSYLSDELESFRQSGTYFRLRELQSPCEPVSIFDGKQVINLASNNYLGLANHPKLVEAALDATRKYGAGSGAVRTISGTMSLHMDLERRIAEFKHAEACVVFQSGFAANAGTVSAVLSQEDHIISDELNHASIIDGIRLCKAQRYRYRNNDMADLESRLKEVSGARFRMIATDGVFSMDGIIAKGDRMGRKIGFPTINLRSENELYPRDGVYVTKVLLRSFEQTFTCVNWRVRGEQRRQSDRHHQRRGVGISHHSPRCADQRRC